MRRREFDVPEIGARLENVNGVEEAFGFAIDFRDDASADGFDAVAFERTLERDFLALGKFFVNLQNAAVAAYEKGLCENSAHDPGGIHPGGFERHAERDAIALAKDFCARGGHVKGNTPPESQFSKRLNGSWELEGGIVVGTNTVEES